MNPESSIFLPRQNVLVPRLCGRIVRSSLPIFALVFLTTGLFGSQWVTAWGNSMQGDGGLSASNFTTRYIARATLPGTAVRIRLSNLYGTSSVTFQHVYIGPRTSGPNVSSNTQVYFGGNASVTLSAGSEITSDSVSLGVTAQEDLAVSMYFSSVTDNTIHTVSYVTQYETALDGTGGDHSTETSNASTYFTAITNTTVSWLEAVDVLNADASSCAVVAIGDSITDGYMNNGVGPVDNYVRWTDVVGQRLFGIGSQTSIINEGISGNMVYHSGGVGPTAVSRASRDVQGQSGVKYCILFEGTNDIGAGADASTLETNLTTIVNQLHANSPSIKVIGATILPRGSLNTTRNTVNDWIRNSGTYDGVIDFDPVMQDPNNLGSLLPAYDSGDGVHPNATGHAAMGAAIDLTLFGIQGAVWDAYVQFTSTQGSNGWYYQQRPQGATSPLINMNFTDGGWRTTEYPSGSAGWLADYLGIAAGHPGQYVDDMKKWVAPSGGTVSVTGRVYKVDTGGGAGIIATVEKNGTVIWSRTVAYNDSTGYTTDADLGAVSVNTGDSLAFIVDDNGVFGNDWFGWDPVITKTATYDAYVQFTSTQGSNGWYYQQRPQGATSPLINMNFTDGGWRTTEYPSGSAGWLTDYLGIAAGHPGQYVDDMRKWIAPSAGTVHVKGRVYKVDTGGGAGIIATVEKNGTLIWSKTVAYNDATGYSTDANLSNISVSANDTIAFIVDDNGVFGNDWFGWDPVVSFAPER